MNTARKKILAMLIGIAFALGLVLFSPGTAQAAQPTWLCARTHPNSTVTSIQFHWHYTSDYYGNVSRSVVQGEGGCGVIGAVQTNGYPFGFTLPPGYCAHFRSGAGQRPANSITLSDIIWENSTLHKVGTYATSTFWDFRTEAAFDQYFGPTDYEAEIFDVKIFTPVNGSCA